MRGLKLTIEPKPVSTWGITLASRLPRDEWGELRQECYRDADYTCRVCDTTTSELHAHEVWVFDDKKRVQKLLGLLCLCEACHDVKHFGRSSQVFPKSYLETLIKHWCKVNGKTRQDFSKYLVEIHRINRKRADHQYIVKVGRRTLV